MPMITPLDIFKDLGADDLKGYQKCLGITFVILFKIVLLIDF